MTEEELYNLKELLIKQGLDIRKAEDVCLLLQFKPDNVQRAFYLRCQGKTQKEISELIGVSQQQIGKYIRVNCCEVKEYLQLFSCKT